MKRSLKTLNITGIALLAIVALQSCSKEASAEIAEEQFEVAELQISDESEMISEEVLNIGEEVYATDEIESSSKGSFNSGFLPECVTITTVITANTKTKTIDFGDGCELPNGNFLSGIIYLSYAKDMDMATKTLALSLEDFTFNGVAITGSASIVRMRANENGNPQSDAEAGFSATWPDGATASFEGQRTREWIEGYGSGFWGDNVFLITGLRTFTGPQGNTFQKEVITPLRRELSCRFLVSGVLEISRNDQTASLDFGSGECDAKGILTYPNGETEEIFLRRFNR
ncbi:hypothetical protein PP178_00170 [Zeaxanthinibacter sp. PT1]|uniref:hypothetical protein n=1 Tax=Zeaxanthinibacter TaxID=561554 RepID=UPI00234B1EFF|nr:hypothetical protein [Zeaxanthinibacter sp. PT1]MDC6349952.1 hypothetical protein [Zeaxanthinibacter sp. PT1]